MTTQGMKAHSSHANRARIERTYARIHSVNLRDPYLTQVRFWDSLQPTENNGSSGRTRIRL